jgi:hypothetical protein
MASTTYGLCAIVALVTACLFLTAFRRHRHRLLLWSGLCFVGFTANNILLVLDKVIFPDVDLSIFRTGIALASLSTLLFGLVWDLE